MIMIMPQIGMSMQEGTINKWMVKDGDKVEKGQVILEITTEKLTNEIEAQASGTFKMIAKEGDIIPCGGDIAEIIE